MRAVCSLADQSPNHFSESPYWAIDVCTMKRSREESSNAEEQPTSEAQRSRRDVASEAGPAVGSVVDSAAAGPRAPAAVTTAAQSREHSTLYLDTVSRERLDFDMERVCSVTLTDRNIYSCLVCGQYFQGRGKTTPAYTHALQSDHRVFLNLETTDIYVLPDGYQVKDASLNDIKQALRPTFSPAEIARLDTDATLALDAHGGSYRPGLMGVNNLGKTDYITCVLHALSRVGPLRDYFLQPSNYGQCDSPLVHAFSDALARLWSRHSFKPSHSPHAFVHAVSLASKQRFGVGKRHEVVDFLAWLLNTLHHDLVKCFPKVDGQRISAPPLPSGSAASSIIQECFAGSVRVHTLNQPLLSAEAEAALAAASAAKTAEAAAAASQKAEQAAAASKATSTVTDVPCLFLSLELPPAPLFKDAREGHTIIPQVPLFQLLNKFNGSVESQTLTATARRTSRYTITKLPPFLVLHARRFARNNFFQEKNPVIITLPVKDLNFRSYLRQELPIADTSVDKRGRPLAPLSVLSRRPVSSQVYRSSVPAGTPRAPLPSPESLVEGVQGGGTVKELSALLKSHHPRGKQLVAQAAERKDLIPPAVLCSWEAWCLKYDLVANVVHRKEAQNSAIASSDSTGAGGDGVSRMITTRGQKAPLDEGSYSAQVYDEASSTWYDVSDLHVQDTLPQLVAVSESNLMVYRSQAWAPPKRAAVLAGAVQVAVGGARLPAAAAAGASS